MRKHQGHHAHSFSPFKLVFICAILCVTVACSPGTAPAQATVTITAAPTPTPQARPTQTSAPAGTLLYKADWSHGLDGWQSSSGWRVDRGQLLVDSLENTSIIAPYHPAAPDYAIEARIQLVKVLRPSANSYSIFADDTPGHDGYEAGAIGLTPPVDGPSDAYAGLTQAAPNALDATRGFSSSDFVPGFDWRTYRVEVQGNELSFFIDGVRNNSTYSTRPALSTGPLGLQSMGLVLRVSSFVITSL